MKGPPSTAAVSSEASLPVTDVVGHVTGEVIRSSALIRGHRLLAMRVFVWGGESVWAWPIRKQSGKGTQKMGAQKMMRAKNLLPFLKTKKKKSEVMQHAAPASLSPPGGRFLLCEGFSGGGASSAGVRRRPRLRCEQKHFCSGLDFFFFDFALFSSVG